ncbi:MAG: hypothetical protein HY279_11315 [Nitrospinae bacterium]|nr:hypothetical protein [Nitrospinota bacterium]
MIFDYFIIAIALIGLMAAISFGNFVQLALKENEGEKPHFVKRKAIIVPLRMAEFAVIALTVYILFIKAGLLATAIIFLLMEFILPSLLKPVFHKYFGMPSKT